MVSMAGSSTKQRLAAILAADAAGYTRLMRDDESATMATLDHYRGIFRRHTEANRGRLVDTAGDSVLAIFEVASGAVGASLAIQDDLADCNRALPQTRQMHFRIGVHLGDVMEKADGTIYGTGVNIAARLEGLAAPGTIAASDIVRGAVEDRIDVGFVSLGEHEVKNVDRPILAYRVVSGDDTTVATPTSPSKLRLGGAAVVVIAFVAVLGTATMQGGGLDRSTPRERSSELPLPDMPSIAVLPFINLSDDAQQEYLADGLTDDLITDLSKKSGLFVIARNSSFAYKDKPTNAREVSLDLGVKHVLKGSVRRTGDNVRINAQLIDAQSGHHLWAERYEAPFANVLDLQEQVLEQVVSNLAVELKVGAPFGLPEASETTVDEAYDTLLKGKGLYRMRTPTDNMEAIALFEKAIDLDPDYSRAYASLAAAWWDRVNLNWELTHGYAWNRSFERAVVNLNKAMAMSPTPEMYRLHAEMLVVWGRLEEAEAEIDLAIALDPNSPENQLTKATIFTRSGRAEEAEQYARVAKRFDPHFRADIMRVLALARFHQGHYRDAAKLLERVVAQDLEVAMDYTTLTSLYGHLDDHVAANTSREAYDQAMTDIGAPMTVQDLGFWWYTDSYHYDSDYIEQVKLGLRKAGVPEGPGQPHRFDEYKALLHQDYESWYHVDGATTIDAAKARALHLRGDTTFVDVRPRQQFAMGHVPGAWNLGINEELSEESLARVVAKDEPVVFSCVGKYCSHSAWACAKALTWGFSEVYYFAGAIPEWKEAGYPVETSSVTRLD